MNRTLNFRYLLKFVVVVAVLVITTYFVHRAQASKIGAAMLHHADLARDRGEPVKEVEFLQRYLLTAPDDLDARERLAKGMRAYARSERGLTAAYYAMTEVLRRDPTRDDFRRYVVRYVLESGLGLFAEARADLDYLIATRGQKNDGDLEYYYGLSFIGSEKYENAEQWFRDAIEHRPDLLAPYGRLAGLLRTKLNRVEEADPVIEMMAAKNENNVRAHLGAADYWRLYGTLDQIAKSVERARKLAPDELDVIRAVALIAQDRGRELADKGKPAEADKEYATARAELKRGIPLHPKAAPLYLSLVSLERQAGQLGASDTVIKDGLLAVPNDPSLVWASVEAHIRNNEPALAEAGIALLTKLNYPAQALDYQKARLLAKREEWNEAIVLLEKARIQPESDPALRSQLNALLGECYEQVGEHDHAAAAFLRAIPDEIRDPLWAKMNLNLAEAQLAQRHTADALETFRKVAVSRPGVNVQVARLLMTENLRRPADNRDWKAVETALTKAEVIAAAALDIALARVDLKYFRNEPVEVRTILDKLMTDHPEDLRVRLAFVVQALRDKNQVGAAAALAAAEKAIGDRVEFRLAQAQFFVDPKAADAGPRLAALLDGAEKMSSADRRRLAKGIADRAKALNPAQVGRIFERAATVAPAEIAILVHQFDLAMKTGDDAAATRAIADIRKLGGENGTYPRATRALYLVWQAEKTNDMSHLVEATRLLEALEREQTSWSRVALAQARVFDLRKNPDAALEKYRQAIASGESSRDAIRRCVELLYEKEQFSEAAELLRQNPDAGESGNFQRIAAEVAQRTGNAARAIELAEKAVPADAKDFQDHLWAGRVMLRSGADRKAEAAFRRAIDLKPSDGEGWVGLTQTLVAADRRADAAAETLKAGIAVAPAAQAFTLARCHAALGDVKIATEWYAKALAAAPNDLRLLQNYGEYLWQAGRLAESRGIWERVVDLNIPEADKEFARTMVAVCLEPQRDYQRSRQALELLGLLDKGQVRPLTGTEKRAQLLNRGLALAAQPDRASKLEAIQTFEVMNDRQTLEGGLQFIVARLYDAVRDRTKARTRMKKLVAADERNPTYLAYYVSVLLRDGDKEEAGKWLPKLERLQPEAFRTAELRAHWHLARNEKAEARAVLLKAGEKKDAQPVAVAVALEAIGEYDDAEKLYVKFVADNKANQPQAILTLAQFYGRRDRTAKALELCEAALKTDPPAAVAAVAIEALYAATAPEAEHARRVSGWIEEALIKAPASADLMNVLGAVRNLQGNYPAAIETYKTLLARNAADALAMNNLAFLTSAYSGAHADALALITKAKQIAGNLPVLMDTEAAIQLSLKNVDEAKRLLEEVVVQAPSGVAFFHLAQAEQAADRGPEALNAWKEAVKLKISVAELHPLERPAFQKLRSEFER